MAPGLSFCRSGHATIKAPQGKQRQTASTELFQWPNADGWRLTRSKERNRTWHRRGGKKIQRKTSLDIASSSVMFEHTKSIFSPWNDILRCGEIGCWVWVWPIDRLGRSNGKVASGAEIVLNLIELCSKHHSTPQITQTVSPCLHLAQLVFRQKYLWMRQKQNK